MVRSVGRLSLLVHAMTFLAASWPLGAQQQQQEQQRIRFVSLETTVPVHWSGTIERLTPDSLYLRVAQADTVAAFSRANVGEVQRLRPPLSRGQAMKTGCVVGAVALAVYGVASSHDPDSPGVAEVTGAAVGAVIGCGVGALMGAIFSSGSREAWERYTLP